MKHLPKQHTIKQKVCEAGRRSTVDIHRSDPVCTMTLLQLCKNQQKSLQMGKMLIITNVLTGLYKLSTAFYSLLPYISSYTENMTLQVGSFLYRKVAIKQSQQATEVTN